MIKDNNEPIPLEAERIARLKVLLESGTAKKNAAVVNQENSASGSGKIVRRLDKGRSMGKSPPKTVNMIYRKINPKLFDIKSAISVICFIKEPPKVPSNNEIKTILKRFKIPFTFIQVFDFKQNVTHVKLRITHPSLCSLSLFVAPEMGITYTSPNGSIVLRLEIARSGH